MAKVSIIIPLYNRAHYLHTAIASILKQTYTDYEVLIIDDGSTDDVKPAVDECMTKAPYQIRYVYQDNQGAGAARNTGIKEANGEYIAFLDADDEWMSTYLEKTVALLDNGYGWCSTASCRVVFNAKEEEQDRSNIQMEPVEDSSSLYAALLKEQNWIGGPSQVVVRKDLLERVGKYREDLPVREDWELWIRLARNGAKFKKVLEPLYIYKIRNNSITKTDRSVGMNSSYKIFTQYSKEAFELDESNKELYADKLWNLGRHLFYEGLKNPPLFFKCVVKSQIIKPSFRRMTQSLSTVQKSEMNKVER